tara:strand:+ start:1059 stop:2018 length:960 start_codon:yes stop_codon:yes gene_type:complete
MEYWDLEPGEELPRGERVKRFGGNGQSGIAQSRKTPNVFLYSDEEASKRFGYQYDGWVEDGSIFQYTGEGTRGNQSWTAANLSIRNHKTDGRALRLFITERKLNRRQTYIGEFELDEDDPYFTAESNDQDGELRNVFVYRLKPVGSVYFREEDLCNSDISGEIEIEESEADVEILDTEVDQNTSKDFERRPMKSVTGERREAELQTRYKIWCENQGYKVRSRKLKVRGSGILSLDLFNETTSEVIEVKSSSARGYIRYAIGQILDYSNLMEIAGQKPNSKRIVVDGRPAEDLIKLMHELDICLAFERNEGDFEHEDPPK